MQKVNEYIIRIVYTISLSLFTILTIRGFFGIIGIVISVMLSVIIGWQFAPTVIRAIASKRNITIGVFSLLFAIYVTLEYAKLGNPIGVLYLNETIAGILQNIHLTIPIFLRLMYVGPVPAVAMSAYWLIDRILPVVTNGIVRLERDEKIFLLVCFGAAVIMITMLYLRTDLFFWPHDEAGNLVEYDALYTTDSGDVYESDCFFYIVASPNDLRQPLFGLFALPFAFAARIISKILCFIPNSYAIVLQIIQVGLIAVTEVMLSRLMELKKQDRILFWLFTSCSFSYMLFSLVMEQYIIAYFYVILTVYMAKESEKLNFAYFGAVSTLLTSGVLFPLVSKEKQIKRWIADLLKAFLIYMALVTVCGQLPQFLDIRRQMTSLMQFSGESVSWREKTIQFTNHIQNMFWAPGANSEGIFYHLNVATHISWIGIGLFILSVIGFVLNREKQIARVAFGWVVFSVVILYIVGWGTAENGLILYALYFAWAYIVLLYLMIGKIIKEKWTRIGVIVVASLICFCANSRELWNIVCWGLANYPIG